MLKLSISIKNPWAKDAQIKNWEYDKKLTRYKHFESQYCYCKYHIFLLSIDTSWRGEDHAGPELEVCLFGYTARYKIYDTRHWNYEQGRWMTEKELEEEYMRLDSYI